MINGIIDSGQKIVTNGLILHLDAAQLRSYPGTGTTWTDLSGNGNNGTLTNGPTFNSANGGSIVFDGVNDIVNCGTTITSTLTNCTFEAIIYHSKPNSKQALISTFNNNIGYGLEITTGNLVNFFGFTSFGVAKDVQSTSALTINTFNQIVGIFKSQNLFEIYINGQFNNSSSTTFNSITRGSNPLYLGDDPSAQVAYFGGRIFNTKIYNRALTATEVLQNYNALKSRYGL